MLSFASSCSSYVSCNHFCSSPAVNPPSALSVLQVAEDYDETSIESNTVSKSRTTLRCPCSRPQSAFLPQRARQSNVCLIWHEAS